MYIFNYIMLVDCGTTFTAPSMMAVVMVEIT